ncbi:MAG: MerR family transcriptional regulator [Endozoicomonas sp. (ex Botrylloides leachii)]|nr:MerR family transcriptional regulator [Endozoicomonas sp. (ex Botrylloides leachii)]
MLENEPRTSELSVIPDKRYFTISEVSDLCQVKNHVLRYWEQEFRQLNPVRRGNRRYYRRTDVVLIRKIRNLLYDQRFTIDGARGQLANGQALPSTDQQKLNTRYEPKNIKNTVHYKKMLRQMITELEDLLGIINA